MMIPCGIDVITRGGETRSIRNFTSYSFDRNMMSPASAFRFTAPDVSRDTRLAIRSGAMIQIYCFGLDGVTKFPLGTGIIDETDTHISADRVEYVLTGRDFLGQLVDNASVDGQNRIVNTSNLTMSSLAKILIKNTRIPPKIEFQDVPTGVLLFRTNPGETKINTLQRYMDFTNVLVWSLPNGQMKLGKCNFAQEPVHSLICSSSNPSANNTLDLRVKRNVNGAIRQIVTQLQTLGQVDAGEFTLNNADKDVQTALQMDSRIGRSVYETFSYGEAEQAYNQITQVGNQTGSPNSMGAAYSRRKVARENVNILQVEALVEGHLTSQGKPHEVDTIYNVIIEDEGLAEPMYCYAISPEMTQQMGMTTRLRLCRVGNTLTADSKLVATR